MRYSIAELWQGISLQPPWKRFPGQLETCLNMMLDPADGSRKRNATDLVADIDTDTLDPDTDYYVTTLREFRIFIADGEVVILKNDGTQATLTDVSGDLEDYLNNATRADIDTTTAIDTVVVLNRDKTIGMETTPTYTVMGEVEVFSQLSEAPEDEGDDDPTQAQTNDVWRVIVDENLDPAGYYKKTASGWERTAASADSNGRATTSTWPHRIVYNPDTDTFSWDIIDFNDRLSGNDETNTVFPFVNQTLQSVAFFSGRLFFIGRDSNCSTRANDIFTIFVNNVNNVTDDDRISMDITHRNVGLPLRTDVIGETLIILCQNGQLAFGAIDDALTSVNGRIRQIGGHKAMDVTPGVNGMRVAVMDVFKDIHFFEWSPQTRTVSEIGTITRHVVGLLDDVTPRGIWLENNTVYVTCEDTNVVYVHDAYYQGDGSIAQSAWSKYQFLEEISYIDTYQGNTRLVTLEDSYSLLTYLHRKPSDPTLMDFSPRLDRRELVTGRYLPKTDETEFSVTGRTASITNTYVVTRLDYNGDTAINFFLPTSVSGNKVRIRGKWTNGQHYVGFGYDSYIEFGKFYAGVSNLRPMFSGLNVFYVDTSNLQVLAGPQHQQQKWTEFQSRYFDVDNLDETMLQTGVLETLLLGDARDTKIVISCSGPGTLTVSAIEVLFQNKGRV